MTPARRYFEKRARAFDRVYARPAPLRGGPLRGRELAVAVVARHARPDVLDLGCGPGRVAEAVLDVDLPRTFDVVLALGLFDYLDAPARAASWMRARCSSALVASFTRRDRV